MALIFNVHDFYDINRTVAECRHMPDDAVDRILADLDTYARSLAIDGLETRWDAAISGGFFDKSKCPCHVVEIGFRAYRMRMVTSVRRMGHVVGVFSYEGIQPKPLASDLDYSTGPIEDVIAASLKHLEEVEFFYTMDRVFGFIHGRAAELARSWCAAAAAAEAAAAQGG